MSKKSKKTFIELCLNGEVLLEEIDDWVDDWHAESQGKDLHEYLGLSWAEYTSWVSMPDILPFIVTARRDNELFTNVLKRIESLPLAARADSKLKVQQLVKWLQYKKLM